VTAPGYRLPVRRWSQVSLFFSAEEVTIAVNGVVRGRSDPKEPVELPSGKEQDLPLEMGSGGFAFYGRVDEIALRRAVRERPFVLTAGMELACPVDQIRFDPAGMLDRRYHAGPVKVGISAPDPDDRSKTVTRGLTVALTGEIREE